MELVTQDVFQHGHDQGEKNEKSGKGKKVAREVKILHILVLKLQPTLSDKKRVPKALLTYYRYDSTIIQQPQY